MTSCRACQSELLHLFLRLGDHPLANGFLTEQQLSQPEPTSPLDVHACLACGLIQIADDIPPEFFRHYVYIPSASDVMKEHFTAFAGTVADRWSHGGLTIDIGCNDGLLLAELGRRGTRTLGIDPATNVIEMAREKGVEVVNEYFTAEVARRVREEYGPASVVVTTNTYHHIGDLDAFTEAVTILLADDGVFIVEVPYAREIVETNQFDGIYHEHVSQFTIKSFADHFQRFGLEICDLTHLDVHGGSVRVVARRGGGQAPDVLASIDEEERRGLFSSETYDAFSERVGSIRKTLMGMLGELKAEGRSLVGYGASARGNTLLNYYGIGPDTLDYIVDRNPLKHGLYSPGMHIPVHGVERLVEDRPDYVLLIAWNFADEIVSQQADYRRAGGSFIVPIPEPCLLNGVAAARSAPPTS